MHVSIPKDAYCEILDVSSPLENNPMFSKCQIKVCYVSDEPNRNGSIITKETARKMANSLPGCPIVGFFNETNGDFEEHNRIIEVKNGQWEFKDTTKAYGFVDLHPKVWFQTFIDDNSVEREYLVTEGYIWNKIYPESQRILTNGNNQSMELDPDSLQGSWTYDENEIPQFFIINEAIISKLCILGEEVEPCFEGAQIKVSFSLGDRLENQIYSMMQSYNEGGQETVNETNTVQQAEEATVDYTLEEETVTENSLNEEASTTVEEAPAEEFATKDDDDKEKDESSDEEDKKEDEEEYEKRKKKTRCSLEDEPEYVELRDAFNTLTTSFAQIKGELEKANSELENLRAFKANIERTEKENLINTFAMLSDEDKKDVLDNIDSYSLETIESKLAVICLRKGLFTAAIDSTEDTTEDLPLTYSVDNKDNDSTLPAWLQEVDKVAKSIN